MFVIAVKPASRTDFDDFYRQHCAQRKAPVGRPHEHIQISYSEGDFDVIRPAGATRSTDAVKFSVEE